MMVYWSGSPAGLTSHLGEPRRPISDCRDRSVAVATSSPSRPRRAYGLRRLQRAGDLNAFTDEPTNPDALPHVSQPVVRAQTRISYSLSRPHFRPDNCYIVKAGVGGVPSQVERGRYLVAPDKVTLAPYSGLGHGFGGPRGFDVDLYDGDLCLIGGFRPDGHRTPSTRL
jgi:hypothetical protein